MKNWLMLTVIGRDRPGIVAAVTDALYKGGCSLGETSMIRLGGNFTIMMMVEHTGDPRSVETMLAAPAAAMSLHVHVDAIEGHLHEHVVPDVRISVHGADRPGIVARVTGALARAGLNIIDLESDVAGTAAAPIYVMHVEGLAENGVEALREALAAIEDTGIKVTLTPVETMIA